MVSGWSMMSFKPPVKNSLTCICVDAAGSSALWYWAESTEMTTLGLSSLSCRPNNARHLTVRLVIPRAGFFFESSRSLSLPDAFKSSSVLAHVFWKCFKAIDFCLWNLYSLPEGKDTEDLFPTLKAKTPRGSIQSILFCLALVSFFLKCGIQQTATKKPYCLLDPLLTVFPPW